MTYELILSSEADYMFCYQVTKQNMYDLFCRHWGGWVDSKFKEGFVLENIKIITIKAEKIGFFSCKIDEEFYYIDNIQISPEYQNRGIGSKILRDFILEHQDSAIRLTTFVDNPAVRLYERLGFQAFEQKGATLLLERKV